VDDGAVLDDTDQKLGHVDEDVECAEVVRHPAPGFHVGEQAALIAAIVDVERLAQIRRYRGVDGCDLGPLLEAHDGVSQGAVIKICIGRRAIGFQSRRRHFQPLTDETDLPMRFSRRDLRPVGNFLKLLFGVRAQRNKLLAQALELRVLGMQAAQVGGLVGRGDQRFEQLGTLDQLRLAVNIGR